MRLAVRPVAQNLGRSKRFRRPSKIPPEQWKWMQQARRNPQPNHCKTEPRRSAKNSSEHFPHNLWKRNMRKLKPAFPPTRSWKKVNSTRKKTKKASSPLPRPKKGKKKSFTKKKPKKSSTQHLLTNTLITKIPGVRRQSKKRNSVATKNTKLLRLIAID